MNKIWIGLVSMTCGYSLITCIWGNPGLFEQVVATIAFVLAIVILASGGEILETDQDY